MQTILIKNALLIATLDEQDKIYEGGDIYIESNQIKDIGYNLSYNADIIIDGKNKLVLPGFVNTHHHLYQTLCRNIPKVQNAKLFDWLIYLYEIWRGLTPDAVYISAKVGIGELLLTGCTTTTDHFYVFPKAQTQHLLDYEIEAAKEMGIRFHPCRGSMSRGRSLGGLPPDDVVQSEDEILKDCQRVIEKYHNSEKFSMCKIALAPCSPFSVTDDLLKETISLSKQYNVRCHTHLAETLDEEKFCIETHKMRPVEYMQSLGWIGEHIWFAHAVYLNDDEIELIARTKTGIAHCPTSNLRLASGIAPIPKLLKHNARLSVAVDGSASNDSSDMLAELRMALLIHRVTSGPDATDARTILKMATRGGANVLGYDEIGTLEIGKAADIILYDMNQLGFAGAMHDPLSAILFAGYNHKVHTSIVNGNIVVKDGRLVNVDEEKLIESANRIAKEMVNKIL